MAKNPGRYANTPDTPLPKGPIGKAPRHLSADEQKVWREITSGAPEGVLGSCDAISVEIAVRLTNRMRTGKFDKQSDFTTLFNILSKLGLNPSDRTRVHAVPSAPAKTVDALDELD